MPWNKVQNTLWSNYSVTAMVFNGNPQLLWLSLCQVITSLHFDGHLEVYVMYVTNISNILGKKVCVSIIFKDIAKL